MLKEENTYIKDLVKAIIIIFFYLTVSFYSGYIAEDLGINTLIGEVIFSLSCEFLMIAVIIYAYKDDLIPMFKDFKKNIKLYFNKYFKYWILILVLMFFSNILVTQFTSTEVATNQEIIIKTFEVLPIYILISTIIISPITEELVFRFCIKKVIPKPSILYILTSGIIFGSMHVIFTLTDISNLLFIIPYSIPGIVFAYLYNKTDNIFIPIGLHFIHNTVLMALEIILLMV